MDRIGSSTGSSIGGVSTLIGSSDILETIISSFGAFLFSCYIVYDTQLIVGGDHRKYQFSEF